MAGYRRFAAYVYEYRNGRKDKNCGFIKVEVRDGKCTMEVHLNCPGVAAGEACRVYGFVRGDGLLNGILLGDCEAAAGRVECTLEADSGNLGDSGVSFAKVGGVLLLMDGGGFFGTEWDDQAIRPANFREMPVKKEKHETQAKVEKPQEKAEVQAAAFENEENLKEAAETVGDEETAGGAETAEGADAARMAETAGEAGTVQETEGAGAAEAVNEAGTTGEANVAEKLEAEGETEAAAVPRLDSGPKPPQPGPGPKPPQPGPGPKPPQPGPGAKPPMPGPGAKPPMPGSGAKPPMPGSGAKPPMPGSGAKPPIPGSGAKPPMSGSGSKPPMPGPGAKPPQPGPGAKPPLPGSGAKLPQLGPRAMGTASRPQRQFGEEFHPFEDTDLPLCWKIRPQDLPAVSRRLCPMRNNRFLQYGYYNFGHLLLCRRSDGKYILGVPGAYDQQERFMAGMFGFPWFKETAYIRVPKGRGGYWYRLLEVVDEG